LADSRSVPSRIRYCEWEHEYEAAVLELDPKKLWERVTAAETAISKRLQAISHSSECDAERQGIEFALAILRVLKKSNLGS
jgi:hypothetical protein